ncbi:MULTISPECIES: DASH family cryptochrome [unclassified Roseofilum]|uniref:DASH family cryptochrome n=1 Tax=unclassified Roseofilum TaxID=2620099 RepID=UPI001B223AE6|nr:MULTISPECIES: DASH family cryptochrome [unclassified Roseofilum]MBP0007278.1 DASH family cryptochrome [Roseofilum sp. Belize Diploria]MBP0032488.1 DASH family cryptochrome [Roseofilum sp. Belize BBD 4]
MSQKPILLWYRNDLRSHDHEPLNQALKTGAVVIPVYCFDSRWLQNTSFGFPKMGVFRAKFLLESVANLRQTLRDLGSDLIIRQGLPENIIAQLAITLNISALYYHQEVTAEEKLVETQLNKALSQHQISTQGFWGSTLYHPQDLPWAIADIPEAFTPYRKPVEKSSRVRPTLPTPDALPPLPNSLNVDRGTLPSLEEWGLEHPRSDPRAVLFFRGGEKAGLQRIQDYIWQGNHLEHYKKTRNQMLGADGSSKFSPWLTFGCLSPRLIYEEVQNYESERIKNESTYWLIFELMWRDYFRFICAKHGNKIFYASGLQGLSLPWKQDWKQFERWQQGITGFPLVDANMRELSTTGFMSNRGRQNVASFLTKNLGMDWRMGAEWFESCLIDYDPCSNWGNWNYLAGVGNDGRGFRYFNIAKQSQEYDPKGQYVKHWLPELAHVPPTKIHQPWKLLAVEQKRFGVQMGVDYPLPMVDLSESMQMNRHIYEITKS